MRCSRTWLAALALMPGIATAQSGQPGDVSAPPPLHTDAIPSAPSVESRLREIARRVEAASHYPAIARERGATGEAVVAFEVGGNGAPDGVELVETSGSGALDRAALQAVVDAAPLPFVYGRIEVPVRFALDDPS